MAGTVNPSCPPSFLAATAGSDPVNVGVVIVIVFFVILIVAILGSFFAFKVSGIIKSIKSSHIKNFGSPPYMHHPHCYRSTERTFPYGLS